MDDAIRRVDPCSDYELLQRVGSGTYGEVFKARNLRTGEFAAVKQVKLETGDNWAAIQQEILMLKDCRHPNIISYLDSYLKRDRLWIVMEYCGGGSLQDIYQMIGPLTELQIAFVCRETLKGLKYLHQRGKVHRDVKGANILLTNAGDIKLADFGIAAQITATLGKRKTFIGTPYWMAPEMANVEHTGGYGSECDVWALGITAIELAELKPPYYNLEPLALLHMLTKSSYKVPKLQDKKKWSPSFVNFVKCCLTKNPKKRSSPEKLLNTNAFVSGSLSRRFTRELLDRVNHPQRLDQAQVEEQNAANHRMLLQQQPLQQQNGHRVRIESESSGQDSSSVSSHSNIGQSPQRRLDPPESNHQHNNNVDLRHSSVSPSCSSSSSSKECLNSSVTDEEGDDQEEEVFDPLKQWIPREPGRAQHLTESSYHSERTLLASHSSSQEDGPLEHTLGAEEAKKGAEKEEDEEKPVQPMLQATPVKRRPRNLRPNNPLARWQRPISSVSEQPGSRTPTAKAGRLLARIDESFRQRWQQMRSKSTSMANMPFTPSGASTLNYGAQRHAHQPFQSRPLTCCYGMVPTPQVTMGACFVTVLHRSSIRVNCCTQWFHPANRKQFMVIGAEQGIYALDLADLTAEDEAPLVQLHERRCTWLYVVNDTVTALQGKTPYLYRHDLLQLFQQQLLSQKLAQKLDKLPEKLKPKAFTSSIRMPETKDCYQCNVERSITDGNLYLCCAVPNAVLLFRWYEPLARFVWLKRAELDKLTQPYLGPHHPHRPFNLLFGSNASNSDYPMVCIGISRALTSPVETAQELLHELRNKPQKDKLELQFVDFNENGKQLRELLSSGLFGDNGSSDEENYGGAETPRSLASARSPGARTTTTSLRTIWRWREKLENVVALKQLDRDTLFIAYDNQIMITDMQGNEKRTDLMVTAFAFDFRLEHAIPLSDSVLAFHKHGVQGKSFFRGTVTQDLNDPSKQYRLIGKDSLVVLKTTKARPHRLPCDSPDPVAVEMEREEEDICVLTGHVSTMTPP